MLLGSSGQQVAGLETNVRYSLGISGAIFDFPILGTKAAVKSVISSDLSGLSIPKKLSENDAVNEMLLFEEYEKEMSDERRYHMDNVSWNEWMSLLSPSE